MAVSLGSLSVDMSSMCVVYVCVCWGEGEVTMGGGIRFKLVVSLVVLEPDLLILSSAYRDKNAP